ncbi:sigma-70 family RNA polymerase sigma factor [Microlunatus soli]|uniref:RNA polymerase primary sigma factor n=1 Tax=Microlunatus soli TaxID=630515 RepID=A0A1H1YWI7_9ACTN|nr:sigma-70 family RNA polymerase sigma factor [Microlunatus soli]SDT25814.1 RNA polymerase primary sigma factor [Microlunatus soli]
MTVVGGSRISRRVGGEIGLVLPRSLLTAAEEAELAAQMEAGVLAADARATGAGVASTAELIMLEWLGQRAVQRFVESNLRLVAMVSRKESLRSGLAEGDLFQEGCLGLLEGIRRFDHRRGLRFATYALYWIRAYIGALTANRAGELNLPSGRAEEARAIRGEQGMLSQELGREASAAELAAWLGRKRSEVSMLLAFGADRRVDLNDSEVPDVPDAQAEADFEGVLRWRIPGRDLLCGLAETDRQVIELRYGFVDGVEHSLSDIARRLGLPRSRVRRHQQQALEELRASCPQQAIAHLR